MEQKNPLDVALKGKFNNYIYGCDICQNCCPWNIKLKATDDTAFYPNKVFIDRNKNDWDHLTEEKFDEIFKESAAHRVSFPVLKRNIDFHY